MVLKKDCVNQVPLINYFHMKLIVLLTRLVETGCIGGRKIVIENLPQNLWVICRLDLSLCVLQPELCNELNCALIVSFGDFDEVTNIQESFKRYQKLKYLLGTSHLKLILVNWLL